MTNLECRSRALDGLRGVATGIGVATLVQVLLWHHFHHFVNQLYVGPHARAPELLVACAVALVIAGAISTPTLPALRILQQPWLVFTGRISYGLYLWHLVIFGSGPETGIFGVYRLMRYVALSGVLIYVAQFAAVFAVATLSDYVLELPLLRLKDRIRDPRVRHSLALA